MRQISAADRPFSSPLRKRLRAHDAPLVAGLLYALAACAGDEADLTPEPTPDADTGAFTDAADGTDNTDSDASAPSPDADDVVEAPASPGRCDYTNPFSQNPECKAYTGSGWTAESAAADCAANAGGPGTFVADGTCGFDAQLGTCTVGTGTGEEYVLYLSGDDASACAISTTACETFTAGTFEPQGVCADGEPVEPGPALGVFLQPDFVCSEPVEGEAPGTGPDGTVCTWTMISACTEPGRRYDDYGSCETVFTQRPYYGFNTDPEPVENDPRLEDEAFMAEVAWVKEEVEACACVCCHSQDSAPSGASGWNIEAGPIWTDSIPDSGVAMLAGLVGSAEFGAYAPEQNNGFDRYTTGLPTTDVERMRAFFEAEYFRRGFTVEDAAEIPAFGGPLVTQAAYEPGPCRSDEGLNADGTLKWRTADARYVYVLEAGSKNPGVPPNLDTPEGTIWRLDVLPTGTPVQTGLAYGAVPEGAVQRFPAEGAPAELVSGRDYYLYTLLDIAVPLSRCIFTAP
ncbi:MAG: proteinase inhibitor [Myxococcales bacterium]|nr:proteinase inhibitor [Myxococcales bacterium]